MEISINFSSINFPEDRIWYVIPSWEIAVKMSTFIPIIVFGIIGNLIILHLIIQNRALRTPTNLLIGNMAAADTLTLIVCPIMFMYHDFFQNYMLGAVGCKIEGFLEGALLITAVLNLSAVSYDRLTAIVLPKETRLTLRGAKIVMASTWIAGILLSVPLAVYRTYKERQWKNFLEKYCKENQTILPKYWYVLIAILVWFPLGLMLFSYSAILYKLDRYEREVLRQEHPMSVSYKKKVAKTLYIILIAFIVLRVPFTVLIIYRGYMLSSNTASINQVSSSFLILWYVSHYLIFLNAAVNPLIYGLNNDNFRRAYDQTPICKCGFRSSKCFNWFRTNNWWSCKSSRFNNITKICSTNKSKRLEITQLVGCGSKSTKTTLMMKNLSIENISIVEAKFNYIGKYNSDASIVPNEFI